MGRQSNSGNALSRRSSTVLSDQLLVDTIHKLKNGLGGIEGFATLLQRDIEQDGPGFKMAVKVQEGVRKVNDLITMLMFIVRDVEKHTEQFRLTLLIRQILPGMRSASGGNSVQLIVHPDAGAEDSVIAADQQLIERMFGYVDTFLDTIHATFICLELSAGRKDTVAFTFLYLAESGDQAESAADYMKHLHAAEPKLALIAVDKIVQLHRGNLTIRIVSGKNKCIHIELPKGFQ